MVTDTPIEKDKDNYLKVNTKWIIELSELETGTSKKSAGEVKAFLSSQEDTYRKPYGRGMVTSKRPSVCCATVNRDDYLVDETGSRRFPTITLGDKKIDISIIEKDRDSIWKAAVLAYEAGESCYLSEEDEKLSESYITRLINEKISIYSGLQVGQELHYVQITSQQIKQYVDQMLKIEVRLNQQINSWRLLR